MTVAWRTLKAPSPPAKRRVVRSAKADHKQKYVARCRSFHGRFRANRCSRGTQHSSAHGDAGVAVGVTRRTDTPKRQSPAICGARDARPTGLEPAITGSTGIGNSCLSGSQRGSNGSNRACFGHQSGYRYLGSPLSRIMAHSEELKRSAFTRNFFCRASTQVESSGPTQFPDQPTWTQLIRSVPLRPAPCSLPHES